MYKSYYDQNGGCCVGATEYDEIEDVGPYAMPVRKIAPGPRGGKPKYRTVYNPVVVIS